MNRTTVIRGRCGLALWLVGALLRLDAVAGMTNAVWLGGNTTVLASIEYDVDADWYELQVRPCWSYAISVATNTLWDSAVRLLGADGRTLLAQTDSVAVGHASLVWTNDGPAGRCYFVVEGFAQFTTGRYTQVVQFVAPVDANGNGLPDVWETRYFGGPSPTNTLQGDPDADGSPNEQELLAGTSPVSAASVLAVQNCRLAMGSQWLVSWPGVRYGNYVVDQAPTVHGAWSQAGTAWSVASGMLTQQVDAASTSLAVRVRLVY